MHILIYMGINAHALAILGKKRGKMKKENWKKIKGLAYTSMVIKELIKETQAQTH